MTRLAKELDANIMNSNESGMLMVVGAVLHLEVRT